MLILAKIVPFPFVANKKPFTVALSTLERVIRVVGTKRVTRRPSLQTKPIAITALDELTQQAWANVTAKHYEILRKTFTLLKLSLNVSKAVELYGLLAKVRKLDAIAARTLHDAPYPIPIQIAMAMQILADTKSTGVTASFFVGLPRRLHFCLL